MIRSMILIPVCMIGTFLTFSATPAQAQYIPVRPGYIPAPTIGVTPILPYYPRPVIVPTRPVVVPPVVVNYPTYRPDYVVPVHNHHEYRIVYRATHFGPWETYRVVHSHTRAHEIVDQLRAAGYHARLLDD